ncbi:MAG: primosomal protein N' [Flavobacteriales bacterium]|nr:primosomal protein N' [Flavobacteriales bacterium]
MFSEITYVDVILPLPLQQKFTYQLDSGHLNKAQQGCRVAVPFGRTKIYAGIIDSIHHDTPDYETKFVLDVLDESPIVSKKHMDLWHWIAEYYMCSLGEVMNAALPSSFKLANETYIVLHPEWNQDTSKLTDAEFLITEALQLQKRLKIQEIAQILQRKIVLPFIKKMQEFNIVQIEDEVYERFRPKIRKMMRLNPALNFESALERLKSHRRSPKQEEFLNKFLLETSVEVPFHSFCKRQGFKTSYAKGLVEKEIVELYELEVNRIEQAQLQGAPLVDLNPEQERALTALKTSEKKVNLLHGVTSSGKTEVYIHLIKKHIDFGKQVLFMVPEIALTTQLVSRLKHAFGDKVGVYHSRFGMHERAELWRDVKNNIRFPIVIGARSSVFLPFQDLGLIIVDEEHENSFKQQDPAPRYQARDVAVYMGHHFDCQVVLGTATPSLETAYNVNKGKYGLCSLKQRYGGFKLPKVHLVDIAHAYKRKRMNGHFSEALLMAIENTLERGEQVLLFQNRRGFAPRQECQSCGHVPQCKHCDVSLTYHMSTSRLRCHYCGYTEKNSNYCKACNKQDVKLKGFGTEKIEDELQGFFPNRVIRRMDLDTTRKKDSYENLLNAFEDQEIDILVGTQMISKGLDFSSVGLVGVLSADQMLNFPDFRAFERSFQMLSQVSGRAGRKKSGSEVIIQTFQPDHEILKFVKNHNYPDMLKGQLIERQGFRYPPYYKLIHLSVRHRNRRVTEQASSFLAKSLRTVFEHRVLGPEYPAFERLKGYYQKQILLKLERTLSYPDSKEKLRRFVNAALSHENFKGLRVRIDVDPQ